VSSKGLFIVKVGCNRSLEFSKTESAISFTRGSQMTLLRSSLQASGEVRGFVRTSSCRYGLIVST